MKNPLPVLLALFLALSGCVSTESGTRNLVLREVPREDRTALMVLNFRNVTVEEKAAEYMPWEFGIPSMIMTDLESIGIFNIISWERIEDILQQQKLQSLGLVPEEEAVKIGRLVAARYTFTGSFMVVNGDLRMEAKVLSVERGTILGAASVTGRMDRFFDLEKELVIRMTTYLGAVLTDDEAARLTRNIETRSVDASLNNYAGEMALLEAEREKARGSREAADQLIREARARFEKALGSDPAYRRARSNLAGITMAMPMTL